MRETTKQHILERVEIWEQHSQKEPMFGYTEKEKEEVIKATSAIIKTLCKIENLTQRKAMRVLKMAEEIMETEVVNEPIL